ncbi:MAG: ABC transporter ATP-binding protein [Bacteroidetes bacterium]|nr:ABC transporter ATP-binding protein [Bacteroidota bacterium]
MLNVAIKKRLTDFDLDVSFSLGDELAAIFGPSGSGKSLTLQCVAGLLKPDSGIVTINGRTVFDASKGINLRPQERRVGYVFQNYALLPHLSVADNIGYGLHRLPREERDPRVKKMITVMRLEGLERRRPRELSGGQQQRVALARALVTEPELLLLDEPFAALDSPIRSRLHGELLQLLRRLSITTVLVTHSLAEAYTLSDTMVVYEDGRVLQAGSRDDVLHHPVSRTVARFTATKNLFQGTVIAREASWLHVQVGKLIMHAPAGSHQVGETVDLCIRPEDVMLLRQDREAGAAVAQNQYQGEIVEEIAHGTTFTLMVKLVGDPLGKGRRYDVHVEIPANIYYRLGVDSQKVWEISMKEDAIHSMTPEPRSRN